MSTYSTNLALELIGTGEQAGVWGTTTNTNLGTLIEQAISGYVTQAVATGTDTTITIPNGATGVARNMYIELTGTGGTNTNLIVPANKKLYFIFNNSTGAVTVKVSGQTGVSVPQGKKVVLTSNGTDIVNGLNYIADFGSNSATITQLTATSATITNLTLTSLVISNLSIASANITTLTATNETISGNLTLSGGTANGVAYLDGSKVVTSGSAVTYNGTTFALGAAWTTNPLAGAAAPLFYQYGSGGSAIRVIGDGGAGTLSAFRFDNGASPAICLLGKARGTYASSSAVQTGDYLGEIRMTGYGGTTSRNLVNILGGVEAYTSDSNISSYLEFRTSSSGSASGTEKMRLTAAGDLGIGTASPGSVGVSGYTRLVLGSGSSATDGLTIVPSNTGGVQFTDAANVKKGYLQWDSSTGALALGTAGTTKATLDTSGNLGIGTAIPSSYLSGTAKLVAYANANSQNSILVRNDSNGASSSSALVLNASGNTWGIEIGSSAKNSNALTFQLDYGGANSTLMTLNTSGNLGLGVTPSAWSQGKGFEVLNAGYGLWNGSGSPASIYMTANAYFNGGWKYGGTGQASHYYQYLGQHIWSTAASGTAGNAISFTQAMTLSAAGGLSVGTTGDAGAGNISCGSQKDFRIAANSFQRVAHGDAGGGFGGGYNLYIDSTTAKYDSTGAIAGYYYQNGGVISFFTGTSAAAGTTATERARITSAGDMGVGTASPSSRFHAQGGAAAEITTTQNTNASTPYGHFVYFSAAAPNNATQWFIKCQDSAAERATIRSNGGLANYSANDVNLASDERLKKDISPLNTAWDKVKNIEVVNYRYKDCNEGDPLLYGVIAQQVQPIVPELVVVTREATETDPEYYGIREQPMYWLAIKALQEAMTKIETLEAKVAALEAK